LAVGVQQLKQKQADRDVLDGCGDAVLAAPEHDLLEGAQLPGGGVEGDHLPLNDRLLRGERGAQVAGDLRELGGHVAEPAGVQLHGAVGGQVGLDPHAVVLVLGRADPTQPLQDLRSIRQPLGEHRPHRVARPHLHRLDCLQAALDQGLGDQAEVAAAVVGALQHRPGRPPAGIHRRQRVQDRGGADPQPQRPGDQPQQVAGLQRRRPANQPHQQRQLAGLGAGPFGPGDLMQGLNHHADLQARRPVGRAADGGIGQQLLSGLA